jgi:hypothetical protein
MDFRTPRVMWDTPEIQDSAEGARERFSPNLLNLGPMSADVSNASPVGHVDDGGPD